MKLAFGLLHPVNPVPVPLVAESTSPAPIATATWAAQIVHASRATRASASQRSTVVSPSVLVIAKRQIGLRNTTRLFIRETTLGRADLVA